MGLVSFPEIISVSPGCTIKTVPLELELELEESKLLELEFEDELREL